jgi:LAO/AO transport system kinase
VAVDPTSPFTGGALLGDRVRMERVALDPGVFIRSMATRGSLGGLAGATREVCDVLDAFGIDRILVETVGVGQSELDIVRTADTSAVVLVPESGDSIQTLKAGLMEIADLFVVNKADRPGADRLRNDLELMLGLRGGNALRDTPAHHGVDLRTVSNPARAARAAASRDDGERWTPPVLSSVATTGEGIPELLAALDRHFGYLEKSGALGRRRRARLRERVVDVVEHRVRRRLWTDAATGAWLDAQIPDLEAGRTSPYDVAEALLARSGALLSGAT